MIRFAYIKPSTLIELQKILNERFQVWLRDWTVFGMAEISITPLSAIAELPNDGKSITKFEDFQWGKLVFGKNHGISPKDQVYLDAINEVQQQLINSSISVTLSKSLEAPVSKSFDDRVRVLFSFGEPGNLAFYSRLPLLYESVPEFKNGRKAHRKLTARLETVKNKQLQISVRMDMQSISFKDLMDLKPGKILNFDKKMENAFNLVSGEKKLSVVDLGAKSKKKAILVRG